MSYGYQGPPVMPFPGQKPPNSFGAPPGTPSAPGVSPYPANSNVGFNLPSAAPTSFAMPQPYSPYSSMPYPSSQPQPSMPYASHSGQQPPISQPQQYYMQQNAPHGSYPQSQNIATYPNIQPNSESQRYSGGAYPRGNPSYSTAGNPYPQNPTSYPSQAQNPSPYSSHTQNPNPYPAYSAPYAQTPDSTSYPNNARPYLQHSSPYPGTHNPGGHETRAAYAQHVNTTSVSPRHIAQAPRRVQPRNKISPTVVAYEGFDARADAEALRKAMKGWGTDEKTIINILANRNNIQRQEIAVQFKTLYGKDLVKDLKSELTGNLETLVVAMVTPLPQFYAKELHNAMSGVGTDECVLIEVLCTMSNHEIRVIQQAYQSMYGRTLENDLRGDTSGSFKRLMVSLCCANRDESFNVDPAAAQDDARALLRAGELRFGTDESTFNQILVQRNVSQLQQIFTEYAGMTGHEIEKAIENEFSGDIKKGLLAIIKCVKHRAAFFAEQLYKSMKGLGTQDNRLIRLVVTRSEIDMGEIKQVFAQEYNESLEDFISGDCSGDYKKCLLALIA